MPVQLLASVAVTVIGNEPVCVGVPERTPFAASVRPAGSVPLALTFAGYALANVGFLWIFLVRQ